MCPAPLALHVPLQIDQFAHLVIPTEQDVRCDVGGPVAGGAGHHENVPRREIAYANFDLDANDHRFIGHTSISINVHFVFHKVS